MALTMKKRALQAALNTYGDGARIKSRCLRQPTPDGEPGRYVYTITTGRGGTVYECESGDTYNGWRLCLEHCVAVYRERRRVVVVDELDLGVDPEQTANLLSWLTERQT